MFQQQRERTRVAASQVPISQLRVWPPCTSSYNQVRLGQDESNKINRPLNVFVLRNGEEAYSSPEGKGVSFVRCQLQRDVVEKEKKKKKEQNRARQYSQGLNQFLSCGVAAAVYFDQTSSALIKPRKREVDPRFVFSPTNSVARQDSGLGLLEILLLRTLTA